MSDGLHGPTIAIVPVLGGRFLNGRCDGMLAWLRLFPARAPGSLQLILAGGGADFWPGGFQMLAATITPMQPHKPLWDYLLNIRKRVAPLDFDTLIMA